MKEKTKEFADSVGAVYPVFFMGRHDGVLFTETELETFADLVAKHERKNCAKLCEDEAWRLKKLAVDTNSSSTNTKAIQASNDAAAIRARGENT
jgi:hypothetical protein